MASVLVPVLYVVLVFGSLFLFSSWYRKRLASRLTEPYFSSHPDRDIYVTLLGRTDPPTNDALLKSALVRRSMADVQRVIQIREDKPALQNLLQKGSVGEDIWNSLLAAERELEAEIMEVVAEANTFAEGWGSIIFQTANEMLANEKMRGLFEQTSEIRREKELKYGKSKTTTAIDAQMPTPQAISSSLAALATMPNPTINSTVVKTPNGVVASNAVPETPAAAAPLTPSTPVTPSTPSKSTAKKGRKRK